MPSVKLTAAYVDRVKPEPTRTEIPDAALPGLYLVVQPSGARSWALRFRHAGRTRKMTVGAYPAIGLADAREAARTAIRAVAEGRDPSAERDRARHAPERDSFDEVARLFIVKHAKAKNRRWTETARLLGLRAEGGELVAIPGGLADRWRRRRAQDITRRDILDELDRYTDRGADIAANRFLAAIRKLFAWAVARDILTGSPVVGVKPPSVERSRERVLTDDEVRAVWRTCDSIGYPFGPLFKMLILTGQRLGEVAGMTHGEIAGDVWTLARGRTKADREHDVPLSDLALSILATAPTIGTAGLVFTTNGATPVSGFSKAKAAIDTASGVTGWRLHDLRRTAATGMARQGARLETIERVLNHSSGAFAGVAGIYNRHTFTAEKREALAAWSAHVGALVA